MNRTGKVSTVIALIVIVGVVVALKQQKNPSGPKPAVQTGQNHKAAESNNEQDAESPQSREASETLPHLVDLGAGKCIPCKMMKGEDYGP